MKKLIYVLLCFCVILFSCKTNNRKTFSDSKKSFVDTITVNVDEKGNMTVGNIKTDIDKLEKLLIDSVTTLKNEGQLQIPEFSLKVKGEGMLMGGRSMVQDIFESVKQNF
jgi:hypothetical protein